MIDQEIDIQTKNGVINTFITHPEEDGPPRPFWRI
jgi:hypothetical protein